MNTQLPVRSSDFIQQDGRFWMPANTLGEKLGYKNPSDGIYRILKRNSDELEPFTMIDKMSISDDVKTQTRLFDEQGCYIVAMLAKTEQAKAFRKGLAQFLQQLRGKQTAAMEMRFKVAEMQEKYHDLKTSVEREKLESTIRRTDWTWKKLDRIDELHGILTWDEMGRLYGNSGDYLQELHRRYRMAHGDLSNHKHQSLKGGGHDEG